MMNHERLHNKPVGWREESSHKKEVLERCDTCGLDKHVVHDAPRHGRWLKALGYTPLVSQLISLFFIVRCDRDFAKDFQKLFAQGVVNFSKRTVYELYVLFCCKLVDKRHRRRRKTLERSAEDKCNNNRESWMAKTQRKRLWDLCLPGSHNSHAYSCPPTPFGTDWVLCQEQSVIAQLEMGIRLLDLRLSSLEYFGHGPALTTRLDQVARDIVCFLSSHPTEVVVCLIKANGKKEKLGRSNGHESNPTKIFRRVVQEEWKKLHQQFSDQQCRCNRNDIIIDMPGSEQLSTRLKQKTVAELTENGTKARLILDPWSHWEGSWCYTKGNQVGDVERKSREWALAGNGQRRNSGGKPRLLELIMTVDAGQTRKFMQLAVIHSVESLNLLLVSRIKEKNLLSPPLFSPLQCVLLDYPTESQLDSIVSYNQSR